MADDTTHIRLRLSDALMRRLEKAREKKRTTLTGEIISRLEQSFQREDQAELIKQVATAAVTATLDKLVIVPLHNNASAKAKGDKS